jgi:hypothetical protein
MKAFNPATASMADLERIARHPRSQAEARAILHELQDRGRRRPDTGTMSLFKEKASGSKLQAPEKLQISSSNALLLFPTFHFLLSTLGGFA